MSRRIEFHRLALRELHGAVNWYRFRSLKAMQQFLVRLDQALSRLEADPESFPVLGRKYRYVRIRGFPYQVVFQLPDESSVLITAIAHTSRRPGYWRRRR